MAEPSPRSRLAPRALLVFQAQDLSALRERLLAAAPLESATFLLARVVRTLAGSLRLLVVGERRLDDSDYVERTSYAVQVKPSAVADACARARADGLAVVLVHTHPHADRAAPSAQDLLGEAVLVPAVRRRTGLPPIRLIVSPSSVACAVLADEGETHAEVWQLGSDILRFDDGGGQDVAAAPEYDRQVRAFGEAGHRRLASLRAGIVGVGGTGSIVVQHLAHLGVREFVLIDPDTLEATNLNRVVGARSSDVGRPKVDIAAEMIESINPNASVVRLRSDVRDQSTIRRLLDADAVLCCTDSHGSRAVLAQFAYQYAVPCIDMGVAIHSSGGRVSHVSGRVQMLAPGLPCLLCGDVLDPEAVRRDLLSEEARRADPYITGETIAQPAVVSLNGTTSSLAVTMLLSAVTGIPFASRHQRLRFEQGVVARVDTPVRAQCPVCSTAGALLRGDSWPCPGRRS